VTDIESAINMAPANSQSYVYATLTNHFDAYGDPMCGTLTAWYQAYGSQAALGQYFRCNIGGVQGNSGNSSTNLPMSSTWRRFTLFTTWFVTNSTIKVYFTQYKGTVNNGGTPWGYVDNSVQWLPYQPDFTGLKYSFDTGTQNMTLSWDIYYQLTNHWQVLYTPTNDITGPWLTNTMPISISNNIGSVTFTNSPQRFYRLAHH